MKNIRTFPAIMLAVSLALLVGLIGLINANRVVTPPNIIEATTNNFTDEVLKSPLPVYIEFYVSKGCKPCEAEAPIVAKLANEYVGKVRFVRVDASKQPAIAAAAGITGVPTHIFLKPAEHLGDAAEGLLTEAQLRQFIENGLKLQAPDTNGGTATPSDGTAPATDDKGDGAKPATDPAPATDDKGDGAKPTTDPAPAAEPKKDGE